MYRIVWCTTLNPLGETKFRDLTLLDHVIVWIALNHPRLIHRSAGYSVYLLEEDAPEALGETIWNWQQGDRGLCFGELAADGCPAALRMEDGVPAAYQDGEALALGNFITLEAEDFAGLLENC